MYTRERQVLRAICEGKDPTSLNLARKNRLKEDPGWFRDGKAETKRVQQYEDKEKRATYIYTMGRLTLITTYDTSSASPITRHSQ